MVLFSIIQLDDDLLDIAMPNLLKTAITLVTNYTKAGIPCRNTNFWHLLSKGHSPDAFQK